MHIWGKILGMIVITMLPSNGWADSGRAIIRNTENGSTLGGCTLEDTAQGLRISGSVANVSPGQHGFHIHEFGSCDDAGKAAGSHYNPVKTPHGDVTANGLTGAHAGDLGNITIGADGTGALDKTIPGITLTDGTYTVGGRAIILHEQVDDFSQPTGNAGGRIGCGTIVITGK